MTNRSYNHRKHNEACFGLEYETISEYSTLTCFFACQL